MAVHSSKPKQPTHQTAPFYGHNRSDRNQALSEDDEDEEDDIDDADDDENIGDEADLDDDPDVGGNAPKAVAN